ncbi:hypothetical protein MNBD_ALPHA06-392, partial [hydrothermal vent metagenome]
MRSSAMRYFILLILLSIPTAIMAQADRYDACVRLA